MSKMILIDEAKVKQALEALENVKQYDQENLYGLDDEIATLRAAIEAAENPKYDPIELHVLHSHIAGVLFDFMGWLTSREKRLTLSSTDEAGPAVEAITTFAKMRGLRLEDAQVEHWQAILTTPPAAPVQEPVKLRRGDVLRCIETDELCTVWATSTTHKTLVKWGGNDFSDYTAEQIGELFWLEPESSDVEIAAEQSDNYAAFHAGVRFARAHSLAAQRQWVGLTGQQKNLIARISTDVFDAIHRTEAKLKEKNT